MHGGPPAHASERPAASFHAAAMPHHPATMAGLRVPTFGPASSLGRQATAAAAAAVPSGSPSHGYGMASIFSTAGAHAGVEAAAALTAAERARAAREAPPGELAVRDARVTLSFTSAFVGLGKIRLSDHSWAVISNMALVEAAESLVVVHRRGSREAEAHTVGDVMVRHAALLVGVHSTATLLGMVVQLMQVRQSGARADAGARKP